MNQKQLAQHQSSSNTSSLSSQQGSSSERTSEPVRSRWSPKPEQIHILESIFNSGMVNPPRDETVRIRRLLEKFGSVSEANIFYWFQNRRSRTRRRQRQLKACLLAGDQQGINNPINQSAVVTGASTSTTSNTSTTTTSTTPYSPSSSLSGGDDLFSMSPQMGLPEIDQSLCTSDPSTLHYQTGFISVYINGVPTEVPRGPIDMKGVFGEDAMLVHCSGVPVPVNEYGITFVSLQLGESYFLVSGPS